VYGRSLRGCNGEAFLSKRKCVGSIHHENRVILKTDVWIRPAPRAMGLHWKRQCGVTFSYEERQKTKKWARDLLVDYQFQYVSPQFHQELLVCPLNLGLPSLSSTPLLPLLTLINNARHSCLALSPPFPSLPLPAPPPSCLF
jgi:hypothetical protein